MTMKKMMSLFFVLTVTIQVVQARRMSVLMRHRQIFSVKEIQKRSYIRLSDVHEAELGLDVYRLEPELTVEEVSQTNREVEGEDGLPNEEYIYGSNDDSEDDFDNITEDKDDYYDDKLVNNAEHADYYIDSAEEDVTQETHKRYKRMANEQWKNSKYGQQVTVAPSTVNAAADADVWEAITDEEIEAGQNHRLKETLEYIGITLLSVVGFAFVGICFIRDPVACIFAFGTGCPCCIIFCPCIRAFTDKYLDTKKLIRESMNKYMPGVIVKEDGTMDFYEPTPEEIEILHEIIEEITS